MQGTIAAPPRGLQAGDPQLLAPGALFEIQTGPTDSVNLLEVSGTWWNNAGSAHVYVLGIGVPAAAGVGLGGYAVQYDDSGATGNVPALKVYTQWSTFPTAPANFIRRLSTTADVNANVGHCPWLFRFPRGYRMAPSSSLVLWAITPATAATFIFMTLPNIVVDG